MTSETFPKQKTPQETVLSVVQPVYKPLHLHKKANTLAGRMHSKRLHTWDVDGAFRGWRGSWLFGWRLVKLKRFFFFSSRGFNWFKKKLEYVCVYPRPGRGWRVRKSSDGARSHRKIILLKSFSRACLCAEALGKILKVVTPFCIRADFSPWRRCFIV